MNKKIYIGAMSGTSHDAVDVSIIEVDNNIKKTNLSNINDINIWLKNYFLDKAKI